MSTKLPHNVEFSGFPARLRAAFDNARDAEIARKLAYRSQSPIAKWFEGTYPSVEVLLKVAQITKVNLHWLLTGEGDSATDPLAFLGLELVPLLHQMSDLRQIGVEELVLFLVREALLSRFAELVQRIDDLKPDEVVELRALVEAFTNDPHLPTTAVANLRRA